MTTWHLHATVFDGPDCIAVTTKTVNTQIDAKDITDADREALRAILSDAATRMLRLIEAKERLRIRL